MFHVCYLRLALTTVINLIRAVPQTLSAASSLSLYVDRTQQEPKLWQGHQGPLQDPARGYPFLGILNFKNFRDLECV